MCNYNFVIIVVAFSFEVYRRLFIYFIKRVFKVSKIYSKVINTFSWHAEACPLTQWIGSYFLPPVRFILSNRFIILCQLKNKFRVYLYRNIF